MQTSHSRCRILRSGGFTLIEMMVVVAMLAILGALAVGSFRQNEAASQFHRFVEDVHGALVSARNTAIDDQTRVQVTISEAGLRITSWDSATGQWDFVRIAERDRNRGEGTQTVDDSACVLGLVSGINTPSQDFGQNIPDTCLAGTAQLEFEPDGRFSVADAAITNAGVSLWLGDRRVAEDTAFALIQMFSGGYTRVFEDVQVSEEE